MCPTFPGSLFCRHRPDPATAGFWETWCSVVKVRDFSRNCGPCGCFGRWTLVVVVVVVVWLWVVVVVVGDCGGCVVVWLWWLCGCVVVVGCGGLWWLWFCVALCVVVSTRFSSFPLCSCSLPSHRLF
jgi:hypothetical protein